MTKKRCHIRFEDRVLAVLNLGASGIQVVHETKKDLCAAIPVLGADSTTPALNRFRFIKRIPGKNEIHPDSVAVDEWAAGSAEHFFVDNDIQLPPSESSEGPMLYAQAEGATAADVGGGAAIESGSTVAEAAGGSAGTVTSTATGVAAGGAAVGVGAVAVADSSKLAAYTTGSGITGGIAVPANITLSANFIHDGTTVFTSGESNPSGLRIGSFSLSGSVADVTSIRFNLLQNLDATFFEIRDVLDTDQITVIGHDLYYIGPTSNFNQQPSYSIVVESTDSGSVTPLVYVKTLTIVVTVDAMQAVGWQESRWMSGATLHASDNPDNALTDHPLRLQASSGDDWLLGSAGNDFFGGMASGDTFIGGAGTDVAQLDAAVIPTSGPLRLGFYPSSALQIPTDEPVVTDVSSSFDGVLSWGNEVFIQAEQIRFMLPGDSMWRVFTTEPLKTSHLTFPEEFILAQDNPNDPAYLGAYRLLLSSEDDWVVFGDSNGVLDAGAGNDCVVTTAAFSVVSGGEGDDWLLAGDPAENPVLAANQSTCLLGDTGNDVLVALAGHVDAWGGAGHDTFILAGAKATLTVHDYDPNVDSIVWTDLQGYSVFKSTGSDGSTTFFHSEVNSVLLQSTSVVRGSELSHDWWPQNTVSTISTLSHLPVTWMADSWITV